MTLRKQTLICLLLLLLSGAHVTGVPLGAGERLLKSGNNPEGIAVFSPGYSRPVRIQDADPARLTRLFSDAAEEISSTQEAAPGSRQLRYRKTELRSDLLFTIEKGASPEEDHVKFRDLVRLNLFKGLEVTALLSRIEQTRTSFSWVGNIDGRPDKGTASFTWADGIILGRINIYGEGIFTISRQPGGLFEIEEKDPSKAKFVPPVIPEINLQRDSVSGPDVSYSSDGIIEIMIVWSLDAAQGAAAKGTTIQAEIAQAVSQINTAYANSNVTQRVQMVESGGVNYSASDESLTDLTRLQSPMDGYMDEVHVLREAEKADCVVLITNGWTGSIIGQGYALEYYNRLYFSNYAFAVVDRHYFYYHTLTHELGHNMGAGHERDNPSSPGPQYKEEPHYSCGYHYAASSTDHWHTMMSYSHDGSYKIEHFSNPYVDFEGNPTGLPGDQGTDNARTLDDTMHIVDSFGEDLVPDLTTCNQAGQSYFSPESLYSGDDLDISIVVCNYGDGPSTGFNIDFYASSNSSISENDYYLGQTRSSGIESSSASSFLWSGAVPEELPSGDYYVGWIIDADEEVPESDEDDNTGLFWDPLLSVTHQLECDYSISPKSQNHSASGTSSSFSVTTQTGCPWSAISLASWISISYGSSGSGNGSVVYAVSPNNSYLQRTGRIRVEDQYFSVTQAGTIPNCTITLLPASRSHTDEGGTGSISVSTPSACSWEASSQAPWITILSGQSGSGDGIIQYSVDQNKEKDNRSGTIQVENAGFSVFQASPYTELEKQDRIIIPASFKQLSPVLGNSFVGATALNLNQSAKSITFSGRDSDGNILAVNESFPDLNAKGQLARVTSEILDLAPQLSTITGTGDGTDLPFRGIFVVGDDQTRRLDGIGHRWISGNELYLLNGWEKQGQATTVYLYNTSTETAAEVAIELTAADGSVTETTTRQIPAEGTLFQALSELFNITPESPEGYLKITSSTAVTGFILNGTSESFIAFPALVPVDTEELYAPHFILLPDGSGTEIQLVNIGLIPVSIVFQTFEDYGAEYETQGIVIQPDEMLKGNITEFTSLDPENLDDNQVLTGKMRILISPVGEYEGFEAPRVIGGITLSGGSRSFAALPLESSGSPGTVFPHIAQSIDMRIYTGLAIWNISGQEADITVQAWNPEGGLTAVKNFSLDPNQRRVGMLDENYFFGPGFSQVGGHLDINSSQPIISFCLYGDFDLEYLSTIGGQKLIED